MRYLITLAFILSFLQVHHAQDDHYRDFDFWVGEWNVYKFGTDTLVGHSQIQLILDSMAIQEFYRSSQSKFEGTSLNKFNPNLKRWEQYWVDNSGLSLHIVGGLKDGTMIMENKANRISWKKLPKSRVRQIWEVSQDEGKSWQKVFDGEYRRK
jgi:hypothetical protein